MFQTKLWIKSIHTFHVQELFFQKWCCLWDNVEKYGTAGQVTYAYFMLDSNGHKHILRICIIYCFPTVTMATRRSLSVMFIRTMPVLFPFISTQGDYKYLVSVFEIKKYFKGSYPYYEYFIVFFYQHWIIIVFLITCSQILECCYKTNNNLFRLHYHSHVTSHRWYLQSYRTYAIETAWLK